VCAFCFDASVKLSSPLLDCRVNHSLVKFVPCRHDALTQWLQGKGCTTKVIFVQNCVWCYQNNRQLSFYTEITFISRAILIFGRFFFVKWFVLCYRTVVLSCLSCL